MNTVTEGNVSEDSVEIALVDLKTKEFRKLTPEEVKKHLSKISKEGKEAEKE